MVDARPFVIVGASLAGLRAAEAAREGGYAGPITLVGDELHPPYDRPPLSKAVLRGEEPVTFFRTAESYRDELDVDLRLGCRVSALDAVSKTITLESGEAIGYSTLLIATGASPRTLPDWAHLEGVFTLRSADDVHGLAAALRGDARVVIVGAGFIGSEIASSARSLGKSVTILEAAPLPLVRAVGPVMGAALAALHRRNGTELHLGAQISRIAGEMRVESIELADGRVIPADVVVVGIGAAPATSWLRDSGIALHERDGGVIADEYLETSLPGVYAAGDVVHWPNARMGDEPVRLENWTNAAEQGSAAARNALFGDRRTAHESVPYFWSDWYDSRIQFVGSADADEAVVVAGGVEETTLVALYRRGDRIVGALTVNQPARIMKYRRLIQAQASWADALELAAQLSR